MQIIKSAKFQGSLLWLRSHTSQPITNNTFIATNEIRMSVSLDVRMCTNFFARLSNIHCYNPAKCSTLQTLVLSIWRHWWHHHPKQGPTRQLNRVLDKYKDNLNSVPPHYWPYNKKWQYCHPESTLKPDVFVSHTKHENLPYFTLPNSSGLKLPEHRNSKGRHPVTKRIEVFCQQKNTFRNNLNLLKRGIQFPEPPCWKWIKVDFGSSGRGLKEIGKRNRFRLWVGPEW